MVIFSTPRKWFFFLQRGIKCIFAVIEGVEVTYSYELAFEFSHLFSDIVKFYIAEGVDFTYVLNTGTDGGAD